MPAGSGNQFRDAQRDAAQVTDAALGILAESREAPLFLWVHYFDPHAPYAPPRYDPKFATLSPYEAEIAFVDEQIKRLLAHVEQDLEGSTIVILTADHGEGLGQHGEDTHGLFVYEQTIRVPLVVRLPDQELAGRVVQTPVSQVDVVPTVLELLELEAPGPLDGQPLPLDEESSALAASERVIYFENHFPAQTYGWSDAQGVVVDGRKLIRVPRPELYDLKHDPGEEHNLFNVDDPASQRMLERFDEALAALAARPMLDAQTVAVSDEDLARLRSLGYVGASRKSQGDAATARANLPDPKDMLAVYNQIQDATILIEQRNRKQATELLVQILESKDPANKRALRLAAANSLADEALGDQIIACLQADLRHEQNPCRDSFVLGKLGIALLERGRPAEAAEAFVRLVEVEPNSSLATGYLAESHRRAGNAAEAARWQSRTLDLGPQAGDPPDWAEDAATTVALPASN
jgi:tetratricopeptide (TPR) repeat protein